MTDRIARPGFAIAGAAAILFAVAWLDGQVITGMRLEQARTFDIGVLVWARPFVTLAVAAASLAVGFLGWWARSLVVGIVYVVVGAFFAFLFAIVWRLAAEVNGAPAILPGPIAVGVSDIYFWGNGPLNAPSTVGAAMLLTGLLAIARSARGWRRGADRSIRPLEPSQAEALRRS